MIYIMSVSQHKGTYKVGYSQDPNVRAKNLSSVLITHKVDTLFKVPTGSDQIIEKCIHKRLASYRIPKSEYFTATKAAIKSAIHLTILDFIRLKGYIWTPPKSRLCVAKGHPYHNIKTEMIKSAIAATEKQ